VSDSSKVMIVKCWVLDIGVGGLQINGGM